MFSWIKARVDPWSLLPLRLVVGLLPLVRACEACIVGVHPFRIIGVVKLERKYALACVAAIEGNPKAFDPAVLEAFVQLNASLRRANLWGTMPPTDDFDDEEC
jgi:hypothetical protein